MVFRNLMDFGKVRHFLEEVYDEFREMLEHAEAMSAIVCRTLLDNVVHPGLKKKAKSVS